MGIFKEDDRHRGIFSRMIVVMCAICVVVNLVVTALPAKYTSIDCSATKLYSLTNDTKDRVSKLDEDITIYVLNSKKSKDAKIDETINRYKDLSSHIKVKYETRRQARSFIRITQTRHLPQTALSSRAKTVQR